MLKSSNPASESLTTNKRAYGDPIIEDQQTVDQAGVRVEVQGQGEDSLLHDSLSFSFAEIGSLREQLRKMHMEKLAQNNPSEFSRLIEYDRGKEEAFYVYGNGYATPMFHKMQLKDQAMSFSSLTCFRRAIAGNSGFSIETFNGTKMNFFYYPITLGSTRLAVLYMNPVRQIHT